MIGNWNRVVFNGFFTVLMHLIILIIAFYGKKLAKPIITYLLMTSIIMLVGVWQLISESNFAMLHLPVIATVIYVFFVASYTRYLYVHLHDNARKGTIIMLFPLVASLVFFSYTEVMGLYQFPVKYLNSSFEYFVLTVLLSSVYVVAKLTRRATPLAFFFVGMFNYVLQIFYGKFIYLLVFEGAVISLAIIALFVGESKGIKAIIG